MRMNRSIHRIEGPSRQRRVLVPCFIVPLVLLLAVMALSGAGYCAGEAPLWGEIEAGPHAVGFMTFEEYDYGRTFQAKRDYFGEVIPGETARPIQLSLWYPAVEEAGAVPVVFSDYAFSPPENHDFYQFLSAVQNREVAWLHRILMNNQTAVLEILGTDMNAVRNAAAAGGTYPLLIYACDFDRGVGENAVLCEYLASYGYVIASCHSLGAASVRSQPTAASLEAMVGDMEYLIGALHGHDMVEPGRLGVIGNGGGGLAALLLQMRNYNIDAVVTLDTGVAEEGLQEILTTNPYYDIERMTAPLLSVFSRPSETGETAGEPGPGDAFRYADRYTLGFGGGRGLDFATYGLFVPVLMPPSGGEPPVGPINYARMCEHALMFLDDKLKDTDGAPGLQFGPEVVFIEAEERPPTQEEYLSILNSGNVETAIEIYEKFTALDPDLVLFPEANMNYAGYRMLQGGRTAEAVALLKMNAETYPQSANCWDSLAEAYMANGDNDLALQCVETLIETLPDDTNLTPELREALETNAVRYKEQLTGGGDTDDSGAAGDAEGGDGGGDADGEDSE
jgi:tetratricopeptide (TPR) repeat protein